MLAQFFDSSVEDHCVFVGSDDGGFQLVGLALQRLYRIQPLPTARRRSCKHWPGRAHHVGTTAGWLLLGSVAVVAAVLLVALRDRDTARASLVLAAVSGAGFGIVGIAARTLRVRAPCWLTIAEPVLWALAGQGVLASVAFGFALHRGRTTTVAAITFAVETVFPAAVGLAFLGDVVRAHLLPLATIGFLATLGGSIALARHAEAPLPP